MIAVTQTHALVAGTQQAYGTLTPQFNNIDVFVDFGTTGFADLLVQVFAQAGVGAPSVLVASRNIRRTAAGDAQQVLAIPGLGAKPDGSLSTPGIVGSTTYSLFITADAAVAACKATMSGYDSQVNNQPDETVIATHALVLGTEVSFGVLNNYHIYVQADVDFGPNNGNNAAIFRLYGTAGVAGGGVRTKLFEKLLSANPNGIGRVQQIITLPNDFQTVGCDTFELTAQAINPITGADSSPTCALVGFDPNQVNVTGGGGSIVVPVGTPIYVDPQNGTGNASDANSGLNPALPLKTLGAISARWGTTQPDFGSSSIVFQIILLSDTNPADPFNIRPLNGIVVVTAPLTQVATGAFSAVGNRSQAGATKWTVTTTSFASWTPFLNDWVQDTTTASWLNVEADLGGGVATVTQPAIDSRSAAGYVNPNLVTPLALDNFTVFRPGVVHVSQAGGISTNGTVIFQNANISSPNGLGGQSNFFGGVIWQQCIFSAYCTTGGEPEAAKGNNNSGKPSASNSIFLQGGDFRDHLINGGSVWGSFVFRSNGSQSIVGAGLYCNGTVAPMSFTGGGRTQIGDCGIFTSPATALNLLGGGQGRQTTGDISTGTEAVTGATAAVWGTTNWPIKSRGCHLCKVSFTAELKVTGTITLCGLTTASSWTAATGVFSPQTGGGSIGPLTAAAIDAAPGNGVYAPGQLAAFIKES